MSKEELKKIIAEHITTEPPVYSVEKSKKTLLSIGYYKEMIEKDLIEEDDTIVEFKTSYQTMNQKDINNHLQLTTYSYAYEILYQKPPKCLKVVNFVKTKKPKMIVLETKRDKNDYQRFFSLASQILKGIQSKIFFPRQSFMCKDCEYGEHCRAWAAS